MNAVLDTIVSQFETQEQADGCDRWFRATVEQSLAKASDPSTPRYTTDEVMRRRDKIIQTVQARHAAHRLAVSVRQTHIESSDSGVQTQRFQRSVDSCQVKYSS
jgi:hypothetical protein